MKIKKCSIQWIDGEKYCKHKEVKKLEKYLSILQDILVHAYLEMGIPIDEIDEIIKINIKQANNKLKKRRKK
jgi:hypothetical protein